MSKLGFSLVLAASLTTWAVWAADEPFVGTWKLDPVKSRFIDEMKVESIGGDRYSFDFGGIGLETVTADGTDQPGYGGTTLAVTLEGPEALKVVRKKGGLTIITAEWKLSRDGKSLSDDFTSFAPDGSGSNLKYVYLRTTPTSGFTGTWESTDVKVNFSLTIKIQPYAGDGLSIISPTLDKPKNLSFDGKDYPNLASNAIAGSTYSARRIDAHTVEISNKLKGTLVDMQRYVLSSDLKTLTETVHKPGTRPSNTFVFERQ